MYLLYYRYKIGNPEQTLITGLNLKAVVTPKKKDVGSFSPLLHRSKSTDSHANKKQRVASGICALLFFPLFFPR